MKEHDMVILIKKTKGYPIGTLGCIVHVHPGDKNFIVEVGEGDTIDADESSIINQKISKEIYQITQKLVALLKSGEITPDDIRRMALTK